VGLGHHARRQTRAGAQFCLHRDERRRGDVRGAELAGADQVNFIHMSMTPGTRLGPYEIVSPIGAGGMGEVYRARDVRLQRDVATKVLPEAFAADPERLERFEQKLARRRR